MSSYYYYRVYPRYIAFRDSDNLHLLLRPHLSHLLRHILRSSSHPDPVPQWRHPPVSYLVILLPVRLRRPFAALTAPSLIFPKILILLSDLGVLRRHLRTVHPLPPTTQLLLRRPRTLLLTLRDALLNLLRP